MGTPDAGAFFRVLSEHNVAAMFTAPTAMRAIRQADPQGSASTRYPRPRYTCPQCLPRQPQCIRWRFALNVWLPSLKVLSLWLLIGVIVWRLILPFLIGLSSRMRSLFLAGERCDVETLDWSKRTFGVPVLDHWWQTGESVNQCISPEPFLF